jgi:hypothetical protein
MPQRKYTPTQWKNETPDSVPLLYRITNSSGPVISESALIELLTVVTPGTPVNATNLNHIETGISDAQTTANEATAAAEAAQSLAAAGVSNAAAAQSTANTAVSAAAAAQATANSAVGAASNAQTTANTGVESASAAQTTANTALANAAAALTAANARAGIFSSLDNAAGFSTSSSSYLDVTGSSLTVNMPAAGTIIAFASGSMRAPNTYDSCSLRLVIDGTNAPNPATKYCSGSTDSSWVPFCTLWMKHVSSGNRTIKLQLSNQGAGGGTVQIGATSLVVFALRD